MRVMTWNIKDSGVKDINNPNTENIQGIIDVIKQTNPDIIVLQEYQTEYEYLILDGGLKTMGYGCSVWEGNPDRTLRNRVLIASKLPFESCKRPKLSNYNQKNWNEIFIPAQNLHIIGVHVPTAETTTLDGKKFDNRRAKKAFLDELMEKFQEYQEGEIPVLCLGDFNLCAGTEYSEYLPRFFRSFHEITAETPTWGDRKLDYIFANKALMNRIGKEDVEPHDTPFSDHKYLCVEIANVDAEG